MRARVVLTAALLLWAGGCGDEGRSATSGDAGTLDAGAGDVGDDTSPSQPDAPVSDVPSTTDTLVAADTAADVAPDTSALPKTEPDGVHVRFAPGSEDFFDLPFPSDLRRRPDGSLDFTDWPGAMANDVLGKWLPAAEELVDGWGVTSGVFVFLTGAIDEGTLPSDPHETIWQEGGAAPPIFLIDVDPSSPERGRTWPLELRFRDEDATLTPGHRLAAIPLFGLTRRPLTRYALVLTDSVRSVDAEPLSRPMALDWLLAGAAVTDRYDRQVDPAPYVEAAAWLKERGLETEHIASLTLFTTGDPGARLRQLAEWGYGLPTPAVKEPGLTLGEVYDDFVVLEGRHSAPLYQAGERPYEEEGGEILFGEDGEPEIQEQQWVRFNVTIPRGPMPAGGWPMMLYMHGSGGDWRQVIDRGVDETPGTGPALVAARHGVAAMGFDFPLHGDRSDPPDTTGLYLYNLLGNPRATVDNFIVSAVELTLRVRLIQEMTVDPALAPEYLDPGAAPDGLIRFDGGAVTAMGQSMGSTIGVPFATLDKNVAALMLSGSGGVLVEIGATAVEPFPLKGPLELLLGYGPGEEVDRFDPVLHLLQHYWDLVDPVAHARYVIDEPLPGVPPKHVYQSSGLEDGYFSTRARAALSVALGLDALEPVLEPALTELLAYRGHGAVSGPVTGNLAGGSITGTVTQHEPAAPGKGHYVSFMRDDAKAHYGCFVRSVWQQDVPTVKTIEGALAGCP